MHLNNLAAQAGVTLTDAPYAIDVPDNLPLDAGELRKVVKRLVLTALNARDRDSAFRSFRDLWPTGHIAKTLTNAMLNNLVDTIEARHPFLDAFLFSDRGIGLMNIDAQIADLVHRHFTAQAVPVLSIHDSFIVDCCRVGELIRVMQDAAEAVTGVWLPFSRDGMGLDEVSEDIRDDLREWHEGRTVRCEGYLRQQAR